MSALKESVGKERQRLKKSNVPYTLLEKRAREDGDKKFYAFKTFLTNIILAFSFPRL